MKKFPATLVVALALGAVSGGIAAAAEPLATGDIPFAFSAAGNKLPAGRYEILLENEGGNVLLLRDYQAKKVVFVPFTTRLAPRVDESAELIFDKDANGLYLSEVFVGGSDGYLIPGAPGQHTHEHVQVRKALPQQ